MNFLTEQSAFGSLSTLIEQGLEEDTVLEGKRTAPFAELSGPAEATALRQQIREAEVEKARREVAAKQIEQQMAKYEYAVNELEKKKTSTVAQDSLNNNNFAENNDTDGRKETNIRRDSIPSLEAGADNSRRVDTGVTSGTPLLEQSGDNISIGRGDIRVFEQGLGSERDWSTADSERDIQRAVSQRLVEIAQESGIEDIIKNAVYVYDAKVDDDEVETVKAVHIYYCPVFIDGTQYSARMVVKEYYQGSQVINELHLYNVMLKKRHQTNTLSQDGTPHMRSDASIHYKVSDLIHNTQELDQINFSKIAVDTKGNRYYDHNLTAIEKGKLIDIANNEQSAVASGFGTTPDTKSTTNSQRKCRELLSILQTNASKIVDANGEPMPVYHGTIRKGLW